MIELGVFTFADVGTNPETGHVITPAERLKNLIEEAELAEQVGLDVFGVGEHHRPDFAVSAPAVALAAVASRTSRIRLTSAVTVLGSEDPVRVFQQFATLDLISGGRAEIMAGRGSFIESFPLFGLDLKDYDDLFAENLDLLLKIRESEKVTWSGSGQHRAALDGLAVYPRPIQSRLPIWVAVGGTPKSAARTGLLGLPMAVAIIGGQPERFKSFVDIYREAARYAGHDVAQLPVSINSPGYIADSSQQAADEYYPSYSIVMNRIGKERGWSGLGRREFDAMRGPGGALVLGSPEEVAAKIVHQHGIFGHQRFLMQIGVGPLSHARIMRSIELFGTVVAPLVRKALATSERPAARSAQSAQVTPLASAQIH